jgi:hypothetical protein
MLGSMTPLLLLPLLATDVPGPRVDHRAERGVYFLADLTPAEARRLEGKRARFRVVLDSLEDLATHSFDCVARPGRAAGLVFIYPSTTSKPS